MKNCPICQKKIKPISNNCVEEGGVCEFCQMLFWDGLVYVSDGLGKARYVASLFRR